MKKAFLMLLILSYQQLSVAQCPKKWKTGNAIGRCYSIITPFGSYHNAAGDEIVKSRGGVNINFSVSFDDTDEYQTLASSTCVKNNSKIQVPNSKYEVQFTINSEDTVKASFDSVYNTYTIPGNCVKIQGNAKLCDSTSRKSEGDIWFCSRPLRLKSTFGTGDVIRVTAEIKDLSTVPSGDIGNVVDDPRTYSWEIRFDTTPCPTGIILKDISQDSSWQTAPSNNLVITYDYQCLPARSNPSAISPFHGKLINESFGIPFADGFFELSDLNRRYLATWATTLELATRYLFRPFVSRELATFTVDRNHSFSDHHGTITFFGHPIALAFGDNNINANKVWQTYSCGSDSIARVKLSKRVFVQPPPLGGLPNATIDDKYQVRKIH